METKKFKIARILFWTGLALAVISMTVIDNVDWNFAVSGIGAALAVYGYFTMRKEKKK